MFELPESLIEILGKESETEPLEYLNSLPYDVYLRTRHWEEVRVRVLEYAGYRCQVCNAGEHDEMLCVHHRTYQNRGREHWADLIVLCSTCHSLFHQNGRLKRGQTDTRYPVSGEDYLHGKFSEFIDS